MLRRLLFAAIASTMLLGMIHATPAHATGGVCSSGTHAGHSYSTCYNTFNSVYYGGGIIVTASAEDQSGYEVTYQKHTQVFHYQGGTWVSICDSGWQYYQNSYCQVGGADPAWYDYLVYSRIVLGDGYVWMDALDYPRH